MKKLLTILVLGLTYCNISFSDNPFKNIGPPTDVCYYNEILKKLKPCDSLDELKKTLNHEFFYKIAKFSKVSEKDLKNLIYARMNEIYNSAEYKKEQKEQHKARKKIVDYQCSLNAGKANTWLAARKIYKSCMKAEGY